jgi:hypothetical protein
LHWHCQLTSGLPAGGHLHRIALEQLGVEVLHDRFETEKELSRAFRTCLISASSHEPTSSLTEKDMSVIANNCVYFYSHTKGEHAAFSQFFRSTVEITDSAVSAGSY